MSTLEKSKAYDATHNPRQLGDRTNERINSPTPHQAPQRERVSVSLRPRRRSSSRSSSPAGQQSSRHSPTSATDVRTWKEYISPAVNMGVPTLLMLLEPNVVWRHAHEYSRVGSGITEAAACKGYFFDGHDQVSKLAHGVYEGSYWQLLGNLSELEAMLARMTQAPSLLEEPILQLPAEPVLPEWEHFKPELVPLPDQPTASAAVALPRFVEPALPSTVNLPAPELVPVPQLPPPWKEVVAPSFMPPVAPKPEPLLLPELVLPRAPVLKEPAKPPPNNPPKHGHDWSGKRPFTVPEPVHAAPQLPPAPEEVLPEMEAPQLQEARLHLNPEPFVKLSWHGALDDSADDQASISLEQQQQPELEPLTSAAGVHAPEQKQQQAMNSSMDGRITSAGTDSKSATGDSTSGGKSGKQQTLEQLHVAWEEVESVPLEESGAPHIWLDFKPPFAELPPVFLPPKPESGPEPQLELPTDLQEPPVYAPPVPQPMPVFTKPPLVLPKWAAPCEPLPVGFLRGTAPVLIMDVSGTMHPARRGQFIRLKRCVCELLEPEGELATAGTAFDVLAFSGACWSFSAAYEGKKALLASAMQASYDTTRRAGKRNSGQLLPHATTVARSRVHQHRQQLQQRWQQQAQQACPSTAPHLECRSKLAAGDEHVDVCKSVQHILSAGGVAKSRAESSQQVQVAQSCQQQQLAADKPVPRNRRPGTAHTVAQTEQQQQQLSHADSSTGHADAYKAWLQPTNFDCLTEAQSWVRNWPEAVGSTKLLTALITAHHLTLSCSSSDCCSSNAEGDAVHGDSVDCYYLFSDGLADDVAACLDWVQQQADAGQPLRPVHTVGFFPRNGCPSGERFLSQLAALTGGTYQVYNSDLPTPAAAAAVIKAATAGSSHNAAASKAATAAAVANPAESCAAGIPRVWDSELGGFVAVDLANEDAATREQRMWAEQQLKALRLANKRSRKLQSLAAMLEALRLQHQEQRVLPAMAAHENRVLQLKAAHAAACTAVQRNNELAVRQALRNHAATVQNVKEANERKVAAAHQAYVAAVQQWQRQHKDALAAWEATVAEAKAAVKIAADAADAAQLAAAAVALQKQQELEQREQQHQQRQGSEAEDTSELLEATGSLVYRNSSIASGICNSSSSNSVGVAAGAGVAASQSAVGFSANASMVSFIDTDVSAGLDPEASLLNATTANAREDDAREEDARRQFTTRQTPAGCACVSSIDGTLHHHTVSADDLALLDPASAKLVFPLPAVHESRSHNSVTGWGGTPRLPDCIMPSAAAVSSATEDIGSRIDAAGAASIAASIAPVTRPKSAAARINADRANSDSGTSAAKTRRLGKARSSTDDGSAAKQSAAAHRPVSAGVTMGSDVASRAKRASKSSTDDGSAAQQDLNPQRPVSASGQADATPRVKSGSRSSTDDGFAAKQGLSVQRPVSTNGQAAAKPRPKSAAVERAHSRTASTSDAGGKWNKSDACGCRPGSPSAAVSAANVPTKSIKSRPVSAAGAPGAIASKSGSRPTSPKSHRRPRSCRHKLSSAGISSDGVSEARISSSSSGSRSTACSGVRKGSNRALLDLSATVSYSASHQPHEQLPLTREEKVLSHIKAVDAANRQALGDIYEAWHEQVAEAEEHNTAALKQHQQASQVHAEKLAVYMHQKQLWDKQVRRLEAAAKLVYDQQMAEAAVENAKLALLHELEVRDKLAKERTYAQALADHAAAQAAADKSHSAAVAAAKAEHAATVAAAKQQWQQQQGQLEQAYQQQLEEAQQQHTELVQKVKDQNRQAREAHKQAAEAYRAATVENKRRLMLAEEHLAAAQAKHAADKEAALRQARQEHKLLCQHLEDAHQQHMAAMHQEWLAAKAAVQQHNEEELAAARARYAAAVEEAVQQHQAACEQLRQQHAAEVAQIKARNEEIMPQVEIAKLAATELARVKIFAAHIKRCAAKMSIGVNFLADTPNLDRVVEMAALTDGLKAAFPETEAPREYPWPELQQAQQAQTLDMEFPQHHRHHHQQQQHLQEQLLQQAGGVAILHQQAWRQQAEHQQQHHNRPSTAPAAAERAGTGSTNTSSRDVKASWRAKSPTPVNLHLALQDPSVLVQQMQQSRTSTCGMRMRSSRSPWQSLTGSRHARGDISSRSLKCPSLSGQHTQRRPHTACAAPGRPHGPSVEWGRSCGSHKAKDRLHVAQYPAAGEQLRPGALIAAAVPAGHQVALQQRPTTAPAGCRIASCRQSKQDSATSAGCRGDLETSSGHLQSHRKAAAAVCSASPTRRLLSVVPARHSVQSSAAAMKMSQVLSMHKSKTHGL